MASTTSSNTVIPHQMRSGICYSSYAVFKVRWTKAVITKQDRVRSRAAYPLDTCPAGKPGAAWGAGPDYIRTRCRRAGGKAWQHDLATMIYPLYTPVKMVILSRFPTIRACGRHTDRDI